MSIDRNSKPDLHLTKQHKKWIGVEEEEESLS